MKKRARNNKKSQAQDRYIPQRMCIACRKKAPKRELVRFVLTEDDMPMIDETGRISGRGANLCPDIECFEIAVKKGAFDRALKVRIEPDVWDQIRDSFLGCLESRDFRKDGKDVTFRVKKEDAERIIGKNVTRGPMEVRG